MGGAVQNLMIVCFHPNPNALAREARQRSLLALRRRQPTNWESINLMTARMTVKIRIREICKKRPRSRQRGTSHRPVSDSSRGRVCRILREMRAALSSAHVSEQFDVQSRAVAEP